MHRVRWRGGYGGRRTHGSPDRRVKMEMEKLTDCGGWGRTHGGAEESTNGFFLHFILFRSKETMRGNLQPIKYGDVVHPPTP
jgi:hypothetical protein